jgi:hypothetical protein
MSGQVTVLEPQRLTLAGLIAHYHADPESSVHGLRFHVRENHRGIHKRIAEAYGTYPLLAIDTREFKQWHRAWSEGGHIAAAHAYMAQLRTLINHGFLLLDGPDRIECFRLSQILSKLKFPQPGPRDEALTAEQADAIRAHAHEIGWHSIALAQAFQFELLLRQKDVIGEYVPMSEPGEPLEVWKGKKWLRGVVWREINSNLILRHVTSKRHKMIEVDLKLAPMVMAELDNVRNVQPHDPCIICETNAMPWMPSEFRRKWRIVADRAGIPANVKNMDSRAGGITEATEAGADLEHVKHAATHSNIAMTQRYSRNATAKIAGVQVKRAAHRAATPSHDRGQESRAGDQRTMEGRSHG